MKVAVAVPSSEHGRYNIFWDSLMHVEGVTSKNVLCCRSYNVAENRLILAETAIAQGYDAIWYVDDDQVFPPNTLQKLIAHDLDVVSGLYLYRGFPFTPIAYERVDERGFCYPRCLKEGDSGLVKVEAVGAGCLLVKTRVFAKLEWPWWRVGQFSAKDLGEDPEFCVRVRQAGFDIYCDLDAPVGHMMAAELWPLKTEQGWKSVLVDKRRALVAWPAAVEVGGAPDA